MSVNRATLLGSPFLLGFDHIERLIERAAKSAQDAYPPYNIEHAGPDRLRITLAVAGFKTGELAVTAENNQLVIRGRQEEQVDRTFLHRGIAARQFQRSFILAEGMEVTGAELKKGLLTIELERPQPRKDVRTITIRSDEVQAKSSRSKE